MATFDVAVEIKDRPDRADGFVTTKVGDIVAICPHPHTWTAMEEMSLIILVVTGVEWDDMEVFQSPSNVDGEALTDMDTEKPFTMKRLYQIPVDRVYELYPDFDMAAALDSSVRYQPWLDGDYEPLNIKSVNRVVRNKHLNAWVNI